MGFDISYSTTEIISPALQREIIADAEALYLAYSWVQCDGPSLENDSGYLTGCSRVSPSDPDGQEEAQQSDKPVGRLSHLLQALCELSSRHGIEWEIQHDHSEGVVGVIQYGIPDDAVRGTFEGLDELLEELGDMDGMSPEDFDNPFG
ncbi:MAG: hypothetical protein KDA78_12725 [Planctomycetaceae bacterium]|nr:hypothetical protein [Planctomycetaceae bacterium]